MSTTRSSTSSPKQPSARALTLGPCEASLLNQVRQRGTIVAGLVDPEDFTTESAAHVAEQCQDAGVAAIFVGGSTISDQRQLDDVVISIKKNITLPVILFPGNVTGVSYHADAILFSSLLNSSNPYFIIGAQALAAPQIRKHDMEAIPMGYLVFSEHSSTGFVGQVRGIPYNKPSIAVAYALAAHYLGMRAVYLEAGSGADHPIPPEVVKAVKTYYKGLLIVGGGITDTKTAESLADAGADILVVGNLLQSARFKGKLSSITKAVKSARF